jgi:hypothetical protein
MHNFNSHKERVQVFSLAFEELFIENKRINGALNGSRSLGYISQYR